MARHHLQDAGAEALERLCVAVPKTGLSLVDRKAHAVLHGIGKSPQIRLARTDPLDWLQHGVDSGLWGFRHIPTRRFLSTRADGLRVAVLTHPSSRLADFYREMGDLSGITLLYNNRWNGFKELRQRWRAHLEDARMRPLLLIDEARELLPSVFTEMRLLASADLDSRVILSIVLAGAGRPWKRYSG